MVDGTAFREAIGHFATGVTVITTLHEDAPAGMTASAVASLSLDPPLVLVAVEKKAQTFGYLKRNGCFAINILRVDQEDLTGRVEDAPVVAGRLRSPPAQFRLGVGYLLRIALERNDPF